MSCARSALRYCLLLLVYLPFLLSAELITSTYLANASTNTNIAPTFLHTSGVVVKRASVPSYAHFSVVNGAFPVRTTVRHAIWPDQGPPHACHCPCECNDDAPTTSPLEQGGLDPGRGLDP